MAGVRLSCALGVRDTHTIKMIGLIVRDNSLLLSRVGFVKHQILVFTFTFPIMQIISRIKLGLIIHSIFTSIYLTTFCWLVFITIFSVFLGLVSIQCPIFDLSGDTFGKRIFYIFASILLNSHKLAPPSRPARCYRRRVIIVHL